MSFIYMGILKIFIYCDSPLFRWMSSYITLCDTHFKFSYGLWRYVTKFFVVTHFYISLRTLPMVSVPVGQSMIPIPSPVTLIPPNLQANITSQNKEIIPSSTYLLIICRLNKVFFSYFRCSRIIIWYRIPILNYPILI